MRDGDRPSGDGLQDQSSNARRCVGMSSQVVMNASTAARKFRVY
jgi:hypothetical protein